MAKYSFNLECKSYIHGIKQMLLDRVELSFGTRLITAVVQIRKAQLEKQYLFPSDMILLAIRRRDLAEEQALRPDLSTLEIM